MLGSFRLAVRKAFFRVVCFLRLLSCARFILQCRVISAQSRLEQGSLLEFSKIFADTHCVGLFFFVAVNLPTVHVH